MKNIRMKAYAKINLTLSIEGKLENGYHQLNTVMQSISLYDHIRVSLREEPGIAIQCNLSYVPCDERNIVYKAATRFYGELKKTAYGIEIEMDKRIPVGAGLAGGSSDCGSVLLALNKLEGNPLTQQRLLEIGGELGADVPFTMMGGCAVAYGVGDKLTPCTPLPNCHLVLCKPQFSISTKAAFEKLTADNYSTENRSKAMVELLKQGDLLAIAQNLYNGFEQPVAMAKPQILQIKQKLLEHGAIGALMSGSGSTVYGIFTSSRKACLAQRAMRRYSRDVFVAKPI